MIETRYGSTTGTTGSAPPKPASRTAQQFEATLLTVLIEQAMPRGGAESDKGLAGSVARAQLGEQLAHAIAASGTLGIARLIDGEKTQNVGSASLRHQS